MLIREKDLMKAFTVIVLLTCVVLITTSCGTTQNQATENVISQNSVSSSAEQRPTNISNVANYEVIKQTYALGKVNIKFPQISQLSDHIKQENINKILKDVALEVTSGYSDLAQVSINIDYKITCKTAKVLSIQYSGLRVPQKTYPTNEFYTININMTEGSRLKLRDVVNIDSDFVEIVKNGTLIAASPKITVDLLKKAGYTNEKYIQALNSADTEREQNKNQAYCYFTTDSLGISLGVIHAMGD